MLAIKKLVANSIEESVRFFIKRKNSETQWLQILRPELKKSLNYRYVTLFYRFIDFCIDLRTTHTFANIRPQVFE